MEFSRWGVIWDWFFETLLVPPGSNWVALPLALFIVKGTSDRIKIVAKEPLEVMGSWLQNIWNERIKKPLIPVVSRIWRELKELLRQSGHP
jgi:hypothetical protein